MILVFLPGKSKGLEGVHIILHKGNTYFFMDFPGGVCYAGDRKKERRFWSMEGKILVVDDDASIRMLISDVLADRGCQVSQASSGEEALEEMERETFDLVLLDIMMSGLSGLEVCRRVRDKVECPILFLSAKDTVKDITEGLGLGADDYLTKPFELEVLSAKVEAHLRRQRRVAAAPAGKVIVIGEIALDAENMTVTKGGKAVALSNREVELLNYLMTHPGQTLERERIFREVWQTEYGDISAVATNIKNLRLKLDPDWRYIKTVWGQGYRFVTQTALTEGE